MSTHSDPNLKKAAKEQVSELANEARDAIHDKATETAAEAQNAAADSVQSYADAASAAASRFDPDTMQAEAVRHLADRIEGFARDIRTTELDELIRNTSNFARRNPMLFIGAAAALGFVATRFLKAQPTPRYQSHGSANSDPWSSEPMSRGNVPANTDRQRDDYQDWASDATGGRNV